MFLFFAYLTLKRLYESPGGNQVDGLPPAQHYFRSRRVRWSIREVQDNVFSFRIIAPKFGCMHQIFGKVLSPSDFVILGGPAGGSALERASPPNRIFHMTRRAFPCS